MKSCTITKLNNRHTGAGNKSARMVVASLIGKPLERPPKEPDAEYKSKMKKAVSERNEEEASFGTAKRIYRANNIRAKLAQMANCWIGMCYFVKNVMKFLKKLFNPLFALLFLCQNTAIFLEKWAGDTKWNNSRILVWK